MNLNSSLQSMLDTPTKAFEVALRCFVADNLLCQYPDEQSLKDEIQKRIDAIKGTHIILSGKIASSNILSAKEWPSFWSNTLFSRNCFLNKEHTIRGVQLRKHSKAREKRYSFGYAVSFIFACYQILWTFPKSLYLCSRYLLLAYG